MFFILWPQERVSFNCLRVLRKPWCAIVLIHVGGLDIPTDTCTVLNPHDDNHMSIAKARHRERHHLWPCPTPWKESRPQGTERCVCVCVPLFFFVASSGKKATSPGGRGYIRCKARRPALTDPKSLNWLCKRTTSSHTRKQGQEKQKQKPCNCTLSLPVGFFVWVLGLLVCWFVSGCVGEWVNMGEWVSW